MPSQIEVMERERIVGEQAAADVKSSVRRLLQTAIGWGFGWGLGWAISLSSIFGIILLTAGEYPNASDVKWVFGPSFAGAIVVASSVLRTSQALRPTELSIKRKVVLAVAIAWATSFTIGLAVGGIISGILLPDWLPVWTIVTWAITAAFGGGGLMFWQLGRACSHPEALPPRAPGELRAPLWTYGRLAVLFLLLLGFSGPWASCAPCVMCSSEETYNGLQLLMNFFQIVAPFIAPVLVLFMVTLLRLLRNSDPVIWLERFGAAGSMVGIGSLILNGISGWLWGFWTTAAGVLLALLNLIAELITTRKRRL
jgi:hypothetical protein